MSLPKRIAICGHAGSGKDTIAAIIGAVGGHENIKFAKPAKDLAKSILGRELDMSIDREFVIDISWYLKNKVNSGYMLGKYGFETVSDISAWIYLLKWDQHPAYSKAYSDTFWAELTASQLLITENYVFTDIRLPSEYEVMKRSGTKFVKLDCPKWLCEKRLKARDGGFMEGLWDSPFEQHFLEWEYDVVVDVTQENTYILEPGYVTLKTPQEIYNEILEKLVIS